MDSRYSLQMVFGTETEFGFSFGRVLDEGRARDFPEMFPEKVLYLIIRVVAKKNGAFIRQPWREWERDSLNHLSSVMVKRIADLAASGKSTGGLPDRISRLTLEDIVDPRDIYVGEIGIFLPNGSRLYVDGYHLEYSISECRDPYEIVCQEKAMERILSEVIPEVQEICGREIYLFKNNTDHKGNSYACHSNYLLRREFFRKFYEENNEDQIIKAWLSFIATAIIYTGNGKVGYEESANGDNQPCSYQISQRADHMFRVVSSDTMHARPMINYRGEPLADEDKWGRFHVILDDSSMSEWAIYLKVGVKVLILNMLQQQYLEGYRYDYRDLFLTDSVETMKFVSRDLTCKKPIPYSVSGYSALETQKKWLALVKYFYTHVSDFGAAWVFEVIYKWEQVLIWLEEESQILDSVLDWRIKKRLIDLRVERRLQKGQSTSEDNMTSVDISYHDIGSGGFYNKLSEVNRFVKKADIEKARTDPPENTRAWLRGQFIKHFPKHLIDLSWELIIFDFRVGDFETKVRLEPDPISSTRRKIGHIFDVSGDYDLFCRRFLERYLNRRDSF